MVSRNEISGFPPADLMGVLWLWLWLIRAIVMLVVAELFGWLTG